MIRYLFLMLIIITFGGSTSTSRANSDVIIKNKYTSIYLDGTTWSGATLDITGNYQSGYTILIKGGKVGDLPASYGWKFTNSTDKKEAFCYGPGSAKHSVGKLIIKDSWWTENTQQVNTNTIYYDSPDITWEFKIPARSLGSWNCVGSIMGGIFSWDNNPRATTISGGFQVLLPNPPATITMPTSVSLTGIANNVVKTNVTIRVDNPTGNKQMLTASRNGGGNADVKICFAPSCKNLRIGADLFEKITTTGGDVNVEIGAISKTVVSTTISLTITMTTV
ncbi:TPA: hypothetical protein OR169_004270 [Escherichia coli]|nr:hypothetical protein [Escherichia coli]